MLRRGHLFRCYVHSPPSPSQGQSQSQGQGDIGGEERSEESGIALTLGEKEHSVVQYYETGTLHHGDA